MEVREILIANTKNQTRTKLETAATTLGELKADMDAANIDYSDMTFTEGISKTKLLDDASQLPQNVMYKGQTTNNLVILLTNTTKKISSGLMSRKELYDYIKKNGLQQGIQEAYGRNFTQVPTRNLVFYVEDFMEQTGIEPENPAPEPAETSKTNPCSTYHITLTGLVTDILTLLYNTVEDCLDEEEMDKNDLELIIGRVGEIYKKLANARASFTPDTKATSVSTSDGRITDTDIDDMLASLA